jgi:hypothetical protein
MKPQYLTALAGYFHSVSLKLKRDFLKFLTSVSNSTRALSAVVKKLIPFSRVFRVFIYAINLFISWELIPIVYGKIRVLNMTKSAKTRVENLGEPCEEIREFWSLEGSVSLNPLRKKEVLSRYCDITSRKHGEVLQEAVPARRRVRHCTGAGIQRHRCRATRYRQIQRPCHGRLPVSRGGRCLQRGSQAGFLHPQPH